MASDARWVRPRSEGGSASVELIGVLPFLLALVLLGAQLLAAGFGLWSAAIGARAAARAALVGRDGERAARQAVPAPFGARARLAGSRASVRVAVPSLLPALPPLEVGARAGLGEGG